MTQLNSVTKKMYKSVQNRMNYDYITPSNVKLNLFKTAAYGNCNFALIDFLLSRTEV